MSQTLAVTRTNVRRILNDLRSGDYAVSDERMNTLIDSVYLNVASTLGMSDTWSTAAVTLVAGTADYSLSGTDYQTVSLVRRTDDRVILVKVNWDELESARQSASVVSGKPTHFAMLEDSSQAIQLRVWPTPNASGTLDTFTSSTATALTADSSVLGLSRNGCKAVEFLSASSAFASLTPDALAKLKLAPTFGASLDKQGAMFMTLEKERKTQPRRTDHIERVRF